MHELIGQHLEELTREVKFINMSELEWGVALNNVGNAEIRPSRRAACFHRLIEQGTQDALHGDPGEWQIFSGEDDRAKESMNSTAPERIAKIVQRIRTEFPHLIEEFA